MTLAPGASFPDNVVTETKLNELVDNSVLTDVTTSKLVSGSSLFNDAAPSGLPGSIGENYIDANGYLNYQDGSAYVKDDTVSWIVTLTNGSASIVVVGSVVISGADGDDEFTIAYEPTVNKADARVIGVAAEVISPGAVGQIIYRGLATCLTESIISSTGFWLHSPLVSGHRAYISNPTDPSPLTPDDVGSGYFGYAIGEVDVVLGQGVVQAWIWR